MSSTALQLMAAYQPPYGGGRLEDFIRGGKEAIRSCWEINPYGREVYVGWPPDIYLRADFRRAYIPRFFDYRSAAINRALHELQTQDWLIFEDLCQHDTIHICSLGGGPGCCIKGVKSFLEDLGFDDTDTHGTICDAVWAWMLAATIQGHDFLGFDFDEDLWRQPDVVRAVRRSQIVIISYSLELVPMDDRAEFLAELMAEMSPGSLLIIVDTYFDCGRYMPVLPEEAEDALDQAAGAPGLGLGLDPRADKKKMAVKVWRKQSNEDDLVGALGGLRLA